MISRAKTQPFVPAAESTHFERSQSSVLRTVWTTCCSRVPRLREGTANLFQIFSDDHFVRRCYWDHVDLPKGIMGRYR